MRFLFFGSRICRKLPLQLPPRVRPEFTKDCFSPIREATLNGPPHTSQNPDFCIAGGTYRFLCFLVQYGRVVPICIAIIISWQRLVATVGFSHSVEMDPNNILRVEWSK